MSNARDIADAGHQLVAWVAFEGSNATATANLDGVHSSYGFDALEDAGFGNFKLHFATDQPDKFYCITASMGIGGINAGFASPSGNSNSYGMYVGDKQIDHLRIYTLRFAGTLQDMNDVNIAVFR